MTFFLYGQTLEIVLSFKYLGMYLFKNGFWLRSRRKLAENASKSLHSLFTIFNKFDFTIKKKCDLFDSLVLPVVHYASEIWSYSSGTDVEVIHNKFCRKVLCVKSQQTYQASMENLEESL